MSKQATVVRPGKPYPLGATWDGEGVNFALFSEHAEKVELCLFDVRGRRETSRIELREQRIGIDGLARQMRHARPRRLAPDEHPGPERHALGRHQGDPRRRVPARAGVRQDHRAARAEGAEHIVHRKIVM